MLTARAKSHGVLLTKPRERQGAWQVKRLSSIQEMTVVIELATTVMTDLGYPPKGIFAARMTLEEAICNAIKHGHQYDPTKVVEVRYAIRADQFLAEVEDQGPGFDPAQVPDATATENLERPCGRGLLFLRHYATWVRYNSKGNCVTFCIRPAEPSTEPLAPEPLLTTARLLPSPVQS